MTLSYRFVVCNASYVCENKRQAKNSNVTFCRLPLGKCPNQAEISETQLKQHHVKHREVI